MLLQSLLPLSTLRPTVIPFSLVTAYVVSLLPLATRSGENVVAHHTYATAVRPPLNRK